MKNSRFLVSLPLSFTLAGLAACQPVAGPNSAPAPVDMAAAHSLAQGACGGCHSVSPYGLSPNPLAPAFADIANRPGINHETLTTWLRDAHNYPAEMDFLIEAAEIDLLVAQIISLRRAGYEPPIQ